MADIHLTKGQIASTIQLTRTEIRWKPGSDVKHLLKRKMRRHLPPEASLEDYNHVIRSVLSTPDGAVYVYWYNEKAYVTVIAVLEGAQWLVMMSMDGIVESAYIVENPETYLSQPNFEHIGSLSEVLL
jgi:hypothetical protein